MDLSLIRSVLYVPGDSARKLARAAEIPADALIVDWEDAVAEPSKTDARRVTLRAFPSLAGRGRPVLLRVNTCGSAWFEGDCALAARISPDGVVVPKCETAEDVRRIARRLPANTPILPLLESPLGVQNAPTIAASSEHVVALMFGAEDYSAATWIQRSPGEPELAFARGRVVNSARAYGREVFDSPSMQYRNADAVREAANRGRRLGFTGQAAIHPSQVPLINKAYQPSDGEVAAAHSVVRRFREHGGGVYSVSGVLEDYPALREALAILKRVRRAE